MNVPRHHVCARAALASAPRSILTKAAYKTYSISWRIALRLTAAKPRQKTYRGHRASCGLNTYGGPRDCRAWPLSSLLRSAPSRTHPSRAATVPLTPPLPLSSPPLPQRMACCACRSASTPFAGRRQPPYAHPAFHAAAAQCLAVPPPLTLDWVSSLVTRQLWASLVSRILYMPSYVLL